MMKIFLRHFNNGDCEFISQRLWAGMAMDEVVAMIREWDTLQYQGSYFEIFAIEFEALGLAGYVSLYENVKGSVNVGAFLAPEYRYKGIAQNAITEALRRAKLSGYNKADARVLKNNKPSLRLCERLGFCIVGDDVTAKGEPIFSLEKQL